jgi:hypothetical protein
MSGVGLLNEGPLHAALKLWSAQPGDRFEVAVEGFVTDIVTVSRSAPGGIATEAVFSAVLENERNSLREATTGFLLCASLPVGTRNLGARTRKGMVSAN